MDLLEYQGKQLFARHGIPVPDGRPARTVDEAVTAAKEIGFPCAIKAQVKIGGRGKAGGIKIANDEDEAREHAGAILGMDIKGFTVHEVWIEGASQIEAEYYASIVFDRGAKAPLIMFSTQGGMDIEEVADSNPEAIATLHVDPLLGFQDFHARRLAFEAGVDADVVRPIGALLTKPEPTPPTSSGWTSAATPSSPSGWKPPRASPRSTTAPSSSIARPSGR